jgi:uncharacterized protein (TIGR03435 family)
MFFTPRIQLLRPKIRDTFKMRSIRKNHLTVALLSALCASGVNAQSDKEKLPRFEVASVKPTDPSITEWNTTLFYPGGRFEARGCTLTALIIVAYGVQSWQISGGPKWAAANGLRFSVSAKPPDSSDLTKINPSNPKLPPPDEERLMLRTLLADRFHLVIDEKTQQESGLALTLKKRTDKLADANDKDAFPVVMYGRTGNPDRPNMMQGENASMAKLALRLSELLSMPVVDETGLQGSFDFRVEYVADARDTNASGPQLPTALEELGLRLQSAKVSVRRLVIVSAEQPSGN